MITIHNGILQGTEEWLALRRGMITASSIGQLVTTRTLGASDHACPECDAEEAEPCRSKVKAGAVIKTMHPARVDAARSANVAVIEPAKTPEAKTLTMLLAAERITGWSDPIYVSDDMMRGIDDEPRARDLYSQHYAPVTQCGFMTEDRWGFRIGYSPDGLVGDDGLIEIKSRRAKAQLSTILADQVPAANMAQLQCGLLVSGREWIDYVSYCGGMPLYVKRVRPQQEWFTALTAAATAFERSAANMIGVYELLVTDLHPTERPLSEMEITF